MTLWVVLAVEYDAPDGLGLAPESIDKLHFAVGATGRAFMSDCGLDGKASVGTVHVGSSPQWSVGAVSDLAREVSAASAPEARISRHGATTVN